MDTHGTQTSASSVDSSSQIYDTLDQAPEEASLDAQKMHKLLVEPLVTNAVGFVLTGAGEMAGAQEGYWGRSMRLETGERLQIRIFPRDTIGKPLVVGQPRMLSFRRTSANTRVAVGIVVLWIPNASKEILSQDVPQLCSAKTIGCRGVQVIVPSLFHKHTTNREVVGQVAPTDEHGYHAIRASTFTITSVTRKKVARGAPPAGDITISVSPGFSYLLLAGHMCGLDVENSACRTTMPIGDREHLSRTATVQSTMMRSAGETALAANVTSALTLLDLLSAEGIIGILCNSIFAGALPEMFRNPLGVVFTVVMASRIACFPNNFGLQNCTPNDAHANREMCTHFNSRWTRVTKSECRAIDVAIKAGLDSAMSRIKQEGGTEDGERALKQCIDDNLALWQRVGQRLNTRLMSEPLNSVRRMGNHAFNTPLGRADVAEDSISDAKYAYFEKTGLGMAPAEIPVERIEMASRSDAYATFCCMQDRVETVLRTGMDGHKRISPKNVNVGRFGGYQQASVPKKKPSEGYTTDHSSSSDDDDVDYLNDFALNNSAMESGAGAAAIAIVHGSGVFHQVGLSCFLVGKSSHQKCADCGVKVELVQNTVFGSMASVCHFCNHRRCNACAADALRRMSPAEPCGACVPSISSTFVGSPRNGKKESGHKLGKSATK